MASNASADYAIDGLAGVNLGTAVASTTAEPWGTHANGTTCAINKNRVALYAYVKYDATYVSNTASASVTITVSAGVCKVLASGTNYILLAQDGTAASGTYAWVAALRNKQDG